MVQRLLAERLEYELTKVEQPRTPPVPVWAWLTLDSREWVGELFGWAANANGADDGCRGLVVAPREFAHGFWAEFVGGCETSTSVGATGEARRGCRLDQRPSRIGRVHLRAAEETPS